jgi:hypothetical protein
VIATVTAWQLAARRTESGIMRLGLAEFYIGGSVMDASS